MTIHAKIERESKEVQSEVEDVVVRKVLNPTLNGGKT